MNEQKLIPSNICNPYGRGDGITESAQAYVLKMLPCERKRRGGDPPQSCKEHSVFSPCIMVLVSVLDMEPAQWILQTTKMFAVHSREIFTILTTNRDITRGNHVLVSRVEKKNVDKRFRYLLNNDIPNSLLMKMRTTPALKELSTSTPVRSQ
jgi:hypothetical protein